MAHMYFISEDCELLFFFVTEDYELKDRIGVKDEKALVAQAVAGKCICMHLLPGS